MPRGAHFVVICMAKQRGNGSFSIEIGVREPRVEIFAAEIRILRYVDGIIGALFNFAFCIYSSFPVEIFKNIC